MLSKPLAALAALCAAVSVSGIAPAFADGIPAATQRTTVKAGKHVAVRRVGYTYVRGTWPGGPDPYAYSYKRPGYYPYYNSRYWVPRKQMLGRSKFPMRLPEYHSSWGYPVACKVQGRRHCGVAFKSRAGDPRHYYRRDVQLRTRTSHR